MARTRRTKRTADEKNVDAEDVDNKSVSTSISAKVNVAKVPSKNGSNVLECTNISKQNHSNDDIKNRFPVWHPNRCPSGINLCELEKQMDGCLYKETIGSLPDKASEEKKKIYNNLLHLDIKLNWTYPLLEAIYN